MDWLKQVQNAIDYIEDNLTSKIDYEEVAKRAYLSTYHFQRVFSITCGFTLGEYIRCRKLTLAGKDLLNKGSKVIDISLKYGYETPESFSRAFYKFHGIMPSQAKKGLNLKFFPRFAVIPEIKGESQMDYSIQEKEKIVLVGYKKRFTGVPYGEDRVKQEKEFFSSTRAKQWLLIGASCNYSTDYVVITNVDDEGYDFYIAYELDEWTMKELFNPNVTGVDFIDKMGFERIDIPKQTYVVFKTEKKKRPIADYTELRKKIVNEWLPNGDYVFTNAPEVVAMHWRPNGEWAKERYIEIRIPIEKINKKTAL